MTHQNNDFRSFFGITDALKIHDFHRFFSQLRYWYCSSLGRTNSTNGKTAIQTKQATVTAHAGDEKNLNTRFGIMWAIGVTTYKSEIWIVTVRDRPIYRADIWVLPIYRYPPKWPILSASVGVDKMLLYSSRMQTTCKRKHNEPSQDSYLAATLAGAFS